MSCMLKASNYETGALHHEASKEHFKVFDKQTTEILAAVQTGGRDTIQQVIRSHQSLDTTISDFQNFVRTNNDQISRQLDILMQQVEDMAKPDLKTAFLNSLFFDDFERREKDLSGPSPKTFEWIFDREGRSTSYQFDKIEWPSFPQWLENADSSQQYWLSGKAGSGKSTLMAHIIRQDMALARTEGHLKKWHGGKPLHILKFFLFRPGRERQAGLESLLRSLLYQLVTRLPLMQEILMAKFLYPSHGARIPTWPVETLKSMLSSALDAADDCCSLIFIDGVDEFKDFQHVRGRDFHAIDLVEFLFEIQKPAHVKLCISSRPELRITHDHTTCLEAKLADLNYDDIRLFVDEQMTTMAAITNLDFRRRLAEEIPRRADGIFLWAAFAVTHIRKACREGYGEDDTELWNRIARMGDDLEDAITQMLQGLERSHWTALAFYLQVLKSWQDADMYNNEPTTVGLITASRSEENVQSRSRFLAACRRERRDIQNFSQGIIEVTESGEAFDEKFALVRSRHDHYSEDYLQNEILDFEPGEGAWVSVPLADHHLEIVKSCNARVSLIHRSAYDFFFAPDDRDREHIELCRSLFEHSAELNVPAMVEDGLRKLLWIRPWPGVCEGSHDLNKGLFLPAILISHFHKLLGFSFTTAPASYNKKVPRSTSMFYSEVCDWNCSSV